MNAHTDRPRRILSIEGSVGPDCHRAIRILILAFACCFAGFASAQEDEPEGPEIAPTAQAKALDAALKPYFEDESWARDLIAKLKSRRRPGDPPPPQLPRKFRWTGRYVVSDLIDPRTGRLGIEVPFVWFAENGDVQMIAGGPGQPIYFTNFIYKDHLYTATFRWPGLHWWQRSPFVDVKPLLKLSLDDFNAFLATARYAGPEILQQKRPRQVHHFRLSLVIPPAPSGSHLRFPILIGDFYSDQKDPTKLWQVLHFGFQNLFDPELDEWIVIDKMERGGGELVLPPRTIDPDP